MILTVTLNLSIDKVYAVDGLHSGEVIRVKEVRYTAGGKGVNVTRIVTALCEPVIATGFSGGFSGQFVACELDKLGIRHDFVSISGETRSCINIINLADTTQTELLEPGPQVTREDINLFKTQYSKLVAVSDVVVISGSVPRGVPTDIYRILVGMAKAAGKKVILDTSGILLKEGVKAAPTIVKPNAEETGKLLDSRILSIESAKRAARQLINLGAEIGVVTMGREGAVLADKEGIYYAKAGGIEAVNTVGCGDAMAGGFAVALARGYGPEDMLRLGVAVSAASAVSMVTGHCRLEDVSRITSTLTVQKLRG